MSYETELTNKQFQTNIVLKIGGVYYSNDQVDSDTGNLIGTGSGVPVEHLGLVTGARINPIEFDIKTVNSTVQTLSFDMLDKDGLISQEMGISPTAFLEETVLCYAGFITGSFDFADYKLISQTVIKKITKKSNGYTFECTEVVNLLDGVAFDLVGTLNGDINGVATSLTLNDAGDFPSSGMLLIDDEYMVYSGKAGNVLTGLSRANLNSTPDDHEDQSNVYFVYDSGDVNPIDYMLQIMISPGGGGPYDVLTDGLGIDESMVDIASFEQIRDLTYPSDEYHFYLSNIGKVSTFLQQQILLPTRTRIFAKNGLISLGILDEVDYEGTTTIVDEDAITSTPQWTINSDKIVNVVVVNFGYSEGEDRFSRQIVVRDEDSITNYGEKPALTYSFKGIKAALNGGSIAQSLATRLLARLATPQAEIAVSTHFDKSDIAIGDNMNLIHRYIPQQGGGLGINAQLEVMSRSVDFSLGKADFKVAYTSYANLRIGLIAPSNQLLSVVSQKIFTIDPAQAVFWKVGFKIVLFNVVSNSFMPDAVNEIVDVTGDQITVLNDFTTTLTLNHMIRFADYDQVNDEQRNNYAFVGYNGGTFGDGSKSYQIVY